MKTSALLAAAVSAALAGSCSFNYGEALAQDLEERTPDTVFTGFVHTIVQDNEPILRLEAETAEVYERKNLVHLSGVTFTELRGGRTLAYGSAEEAILHTDTEDAQFFGDVHLRSEEEGVSIRSGGLSWNASDRVLESDPDQITEIQRDDGSLIRGSAFRADARRKSFSLRGGVDGVLVRPDREDSQ